MSDGLLKVHVTPRGSRDQVSGWRDDVLCIKITAPPVEGAANAAVIKFVAKALGVKKGQVELVSGEKSREKTLKISGMETEEILGKLGK